MNIDKDERSTKYNSFISLSHFPWYSNKNFFSIEKIITLSLRQCNIGLAVHKSPLTLLLEVTWPCVMWQRIQRCNMEYGVCFDFTAKWVNCPQPEYYPVYWRLTHFPYHSTVHYWCLPGITSINKLLRLIRAVVLYAFLCNESFQ